MKITKELSEGKCKKNKSFGYKGKKAWVKNDCRAVFKVCYKPKGEEDDDEEEGDDGEKGNCRTLKLESKNKEKDEKSLSKAKKIKSMKITKELSGGKCKKNKSFGYKGKKAWVKNNCRAVFKVCYKPKGGKGDEDDDEEEGDEGDKGNCRTLKLESKNKEKDQKSLSKAKKIKSMKITKELSEGKCKKNKSFGYKGKKAWVKNDCRAVFKVCYKPKGEEDDDEEEGDDGEKGNCRTLKLESKNKEKDEKSLSKAKKIKSMKITKELSGGKCKKNKSFGYKGKKAWTMMRKKAMKAIKATAEL
ncbi:lectin ADEL-like [Aplysia californica]|uniref:Lectin ADEL-like n=1 Tax=Aplysia californica TaxID=6500 RepID=A0ABM1VTS0_APLCA|nr:lectin ADEL-like [Aplysia californica]